MGAAAVLLAGLACLLIGFSLGLAVGRGRRPARRSSIEMYQPSRQHGRHPRR